MTKNILFGTYNPSKLERIKAICSTLAVNIISLQDLDINLDVIEDGNTPEENAIKKAEAYFDVANIATFSIDSGLFIDKFPKYKQPGTHVRRIHGERATDKEMLYYYRKELSRVGGGSKGHWITAIALKTLGGQLFTKSFKVETYFTVKTSPIFKEGEPLASIQIDPELGKCKSEITELERREAQGFLDQGLYEFMYDVLNYTEASKK